MYEILPNLLLPFPLKSARFWEPPLNSVKGALRESYFLLVKRLEKTVESGLDADLIFQLARAIPAKKLALQKQIHTKETEERTAPPMR